MKSKDTTEVYQLVERALDEAMLNGRFLFKMYNYLKAGKWTRRETNEFIESSTAAQLNNTVEELNGYIKGVTSNCAKRMGTSLNQRHERFVTISMASWKTLGSITLRGKREDARRPLNSIQQDI